MTAPLLTLTAFQRELLADAALGVVSYRSPWFLHDGGVLDEDQAQQVRELVFAELLTRDGQQVRVTDAGHEAIR